MSPMKVIILGFLWVVSIMTLGVKQRSTIKTCWLLSDTFWKPRFLNRSQLWILNGREVLDWMWWVVHPDFAVSVFWCRQFWCAFFFWMSWILRQRLVFWKTYTWNHTWFMIIYFTLYMYIYIYTVSIYFAVPSFRIFKYNNISWQPPKTIPWTCRLFVGTFVP